MFWSGYRGNVERKLVIGTCNGTQDNNIAPAVEGVVADDERRSPTCLFMPLIRIKINEYDIALTYHDAPHQTSLPTGEPQDSSSGT